MQGRKKYSLAMKSWSTRTDNVESLGHVGIGFKRMLSSTKPACLAMIKRECVRGMHSRRKGP